MISPLSSSEIDDLLHKQIVGRIGCHDENEVYIIPMSYAYDGEYIYCHSFEGKKMKMMRNNPKVCFEVDETSDMGNWKSVLAWGEFEELTNKNERDKALAILLQRRLPFISSLTTHLGETWPFSSENREELNKIPGIVFRISTKEKTGKGESTSESPLMFD